MNKIKIAVLSVAIVLLSASMFADCGVDYLDTPTPPCDPPCSIVAITDGSSACSAHGHYEDSCTHEITGYWFWSC